MRKVADWQLQRVQANYEQDWTMAALYTGFMAVPAAVNGTTYQDAMQSMGNQFALAIRQASRTRRRSRSRSDVP